MDWIDIGDHFWNFVSVGLCQFSLRKDAYMHLQYITCMYELRKIFLRNMLFIKGGYSSECIADKGQISGHPLVRVFIGRGEEACLQKSFRQLAFLGTSTYTIVSESSNRWDEYKPGFISASRRSKVGSTSSLKI